MPYNYLCERAFGDSMNPVLLTFIIIGIALISYLGFFLYTIMKPPANNPVSYLKQKITSDKKLVVFIGDSLTHATLNESYPKRITEKFPQFDFVNAGINGYMTIDILGRLDNIINCKPDLITILLGSNDANGSMPGKNKSYERTKFFPKNTKNFWTVERFKEDYLRIIERLKAEASAEIALLSIPIIGEDPSSLQFQRSMEYSSVIKEIAELHNLSYFPVNEKMIAYLEEHPSNSHIPFAKSNITMFKVVFSHYALRKSWDEISEKNGFSLVTDYLHLNSKGVAILGDFVEEFILNELK